MPNYAKNDPITPNPSTTVQSRINTAFPRILADSHPFPSSAIPVGGSQLEIPFEMDWDDQYVIAIGAEYELTESFKIRAGYNYGNTPVTNVNLSPLFPALVEHHATAGFTYTWTNWDFDFAYEHAFTNSESNNGNSNPMENPFYGSKVSHTMDTFSFMASYRF